MADAKTDQEPSIEEILESIRQIISDDAPAASTADGGTLASTAAPTADGGTLAQQPEVSFDDFPAVPAATDDEDDEDVLDLTDKAVPAQAPVIDLQDAPQQADAIFDAPVQQPAPAATAPAAPVVPDTATDTGALLSDVTADVSAHAMARLLAGNIAVERDLPGRVGNVTLEDMTRELLRPLVKTWLDQNLPGIIERMVAKEIEKISRLAMKQ